MNYAVYARSSEFKARYSAEIRYEQYVKGFSEGYFESVQKGLLDLLAECGVTVSDEVRAQITACGDLEQLKRWTLLAAAGRSAEEIFG